MPPRILRFGALTAEHRAPAENYSNLQEHEAGWRREPARAGLAIGGAGLPAGASGGAVAPHSVRACRIAALARGSRPGERGVVPAGTTEALAPEGAPPIAKATCVACCRRSLGVGTRLSLLGCSAFLKVALGSYLFHIGERDMRRCSRILGNAPQDGGRRSSISCEHRDDSCQHIREHDGGPMLIAIVERNTYDKKSGRLEVGPVSLFVEEWRPAPQSNSFEGFTRMNTANSSRSTAAITCQDGRLYVRSTVEACLLLLTDLRYDDTNWVDQAVGGKIGNRTVKVVPCPNSELTSICPPCAPTNSWVRYSPSPSPLRAASSSAFAW